MSKSRHRHPARRRGRPRIGDRKPTAVSSAGATVSLPLPETGQALTPPLPLVVPAHARLAADSTIRETACKIYMLRSTGVSDEQIADALGLSVKTLPGYIYKAGKNGWLDEFISDPRDRIEYAVMHKVVANIEEGLEDTHRNEKTGLQVKTAVALKVAEGALFPRLQQQAAQGNQMLMGIKIEIVDGAATKVRAGTVIEAPAYVDGETE